MQAGSIHKGGRILSGLLVVLLLSTLLAGCSLSKKAEEPRWLALATTPDLESSGLLDVILPPFERANNLRIKRLPVSYEQALRYGEDGGVDALLVEYNTKPDLFKLAGAPPYIWPFRPEYFKDPLAAPTPVAIPTATPSFDNILTERKLVFWSDLVLVGPADDRAGVGSVRPLDAGRAFKWIALNNTPFLVAGNAPGLREQQNLIWRQIGREAESDRGSGFRVIPGDASDVLREAEAQNAYTVVPRYLFLNNSSQSKLKIILQGEVAFFLGYEVSIPNVIRIKDHDASLARSFVYYLTNTATQSTIAGFRKAGYSDYLFRSYVYPVFMPK